MLVALRLNDLTGAQPHRIGNNLLSAAIEQAQGNQQQGQTQASAVNSVPLVIAPPDLFTSRRIPVIVRPFGVPPLDGIEPPARRYRVLAPESAVMANTCAASGVAGHLKDPDALVIRPLLD